MCKFFGENAKILWKKYEREIINYDIINISREFHKFYAQLYEYEQNF